MQGPVNIIVGAAGGVGRALASELSGRESAGLIVGLARSRPVDWPDDDRHLFLEADITREASLEAAADPLKTMGAIRRIVVATGLLHAPGVTPERSMKSIEPEALARLFEINAIGPALIAKHFLPLMSRDGPSVFAALSARVGSIGDNRLGGWYGYRASKAALNMLVATLAVEYRRTHPQGICVALHPGTVETKLSAPFRQGAATRPARLAPRDAAQALLKVMDGLKPQDTGKFFAWDGAEIPW
ncbi:SDR family NAD(P)-dependent oxidoreductase [Brevundimonas sp. NPDC092305]|uniref:SDR family NAD(P)-dependent oxidoreductase n=1 Tax=Brevundimonas sp. NPDC092305 TaxID=3363957 RepID=UPI0037F79610